MPNIVNDRGMDLGYIALPIDFGEQKNLIFCFLITRRNEAYEESLCNNAYLICAINIV